MCLCQYQFLPPPPPTWYPHIYSICLCLYFCFANRFSIFDSRFSKFSESVWERGTPMCSIAVMFYSWNLPGYSAHGIFQARVLGGVPFPTSGEIFPTQGSNWCLLHFLYWQAEYSLPLAPPGKPHPWFTPSLPCLQQAWMFLPEEEQFSSVNTVLLVLRIGALSHIQLMLTHALQPTWNSFCLFQVCSWSLSLSPPRSNFLHFQEGLTMNLLLVLRIILCRHVNLSPGLLKENRFYF